MNKDILQGDWNMLKGKVKEKWGKLTDDDMTAIKGKRDQLLGAIQKRYGIAKEKAEEELSTWEKGCCKHDDAKKSHHDDTKKNLHDKDSCQSPKCGHKH